MSGKIGGERREQTEEFVKKVGIAEVRVIAINPTEAEYVEMLGKELKEDSKATEYISESKDGNRTLRIDIWLEEVKHNEKFKISFFLEDKFRENKDETKYQFINDIGNCSWAIDEDGVPDWFSKRSFRKAHAGEEELYEFVRTWLGNLDYSKASTSVELDWKALMKGNVKALSEQIDGEYAVNFGVLSIIVTKEKDGEIKEYRNVYNRAFLPQYSLKHFKNIDYSDPIVLANVNNKKSKDLKPHERFVLKVTGEYGCKDFYKLVPLEEYNPSENPAASGAVLTDSEIEDHAGGADY
jgi:hypothetical protein